MLKEAFVIDHAQIHSQALLLVRRLTNAAYWGVVALLVEITVFGVYIGLGNPAPSYASVYVVTLAALLVTVGITVVTLAVAMFFGIIYLISGLALRRERQLSA